MAIVKKERGGSDEPVGGRKAKRASDVAAEKYVLPTEFTEPTDDIGKAIIVVSGLRKIGKTSLAAQAGGKAFVLAFEIGYKGLRLKKEDIPNWAKAQIVSKALRRDKTYNTIVVDTADRAYAVCEAHTCEELGISDLGDAEFGKGWRDCRKRFSDYISALTHTGKGLWILTHTSEAEIRRRNGESYTRIVPSMSKQAREVIEPLADIMAYYQYDGDRRVLTILGDDHVPAGHRFAERFRTPDGQRIRHIDMGRNEREGYKNFVAAFNNEFVPRDAADLADEEEEDEAPSPKKKTKKVSLRKSA